MKNTTVKKIIFNPFTNKRETEIQLIDGSIYRWNSAFHVYNSAKNYGQLQESQLTQIIWSEVK
jgi:hypothetical protein